MKKGIIGKKLGMTQLFDDKGNVIPVTLVQAGPCVVVQKKTVENDGYSAVQLGFEDIAERKLTKPAKGAFKKAGVALKRHLKEYKLDGADQMNVGDIISADAFEVGEKVDVTGITKGRGFSGAIKRWNFSQMRMSHGNGPVHRNVGSLGMNSSPSRIFKNKKMPGQYGNEQVTVLNLDVVKIDAEKNLIAIKGAIPGSKGKVIFIRNAVKG